MSGELKTSNAPAPLLTTTTVEAEGPGLLDYLGMFRRRIRTILLPAFLLAILGGVLAVVLPKQYQAETKFVVKDISLGSLGRNQGAIQIQHKPLLLRTEDEIKSPQFLQPIINRLGISEGYNVSRPEEFSELLDYINKNLKIAVDKAKVGDDRVVIRYRGRNQAKVVEFIDTVRENYRDHFQKQFRRPAREKFQQSMAAKEALGRQLNAVQAEYRVHASSKDAYLLTEGKGLREEAVKLRDAKTEAEVRFSSLKSELTRAENQLRQAPPESREKSLIPNEEKLSLIGLRDAAKAEVNRLLAKGLTDLTAELKNAKGAVAELDQQINALDDTIELPGRIVPNDQWGALSTEVFRLKRALEAKDEEIKEYGKRLKEIEKDLALIPEIEARDARLKGEIARLEDQLVPVNRAHVLFQDHWEEVRDADLFRVLEFPHANDPPVFPSVPIFILIGLAAGLFVGLGLAILREFSGMTYATAAQVKGAVPIPVLGEVSRIVSDEELQDERRRRRRNILIIVLIVALIGLLHLFYFNEDLSRHLPTELASFMDKIYLGR